MKNTTFGLAVAAALITALPAGAQQQQPYYREIQQIHMIDGMSALVTTPRGNYRIGFRTMCMVEQQGEFFVLDRFQLGQSVSPGDVFESSGVAPPCTIESVTPMRGLVQHEGE